MSPQVYVVSPGELGDSEASGCCILPALSTQTVMCADPG